MRVRPSLSSSGSGCNGSGLGKCWEAAGHAVTFPFPTVLLFQELPSGRCDAAPLHAWPQRIETNEANKTKQTNKTNPNNNSGGTKEER